MCCVRCTPVLPQWHVKDPGHFAKSACGRLQLNTHTPLTHKPKWSDDAAIQAECGNLSGNELTRNLSGNSRPQSSQLAKPLWTDLGLKSGISVRELISTKKTKNNKKPQQQQKTQAGSEWPNILPKSLQVRKKPPPTIGLKRHVKLTARVTSGRI